MLGLDNPLHILIVLVVVLLVFGAKRLPEMGKSLGEGLRGFKSSISEEPSLHPMSSAHDEPSDHPVNAIEPVPTAVAPAVPQAERPAQPVA